MKKCSYTQWFHAPYRIISGEIFTRLAFNSQGRKGEKFPRKNIPQ